MSEIKSIPSIPAKMGEAGAYQEQLFSILSAMKENIEAQGERVAENITALSTGADAAAIVTTVNALLATLKEKGIMTDDAASE